MLLLSGCGGGTFGAQQAAVVAGQCIAPAHPVGVSVLDAAGRLLNRRGVHLVDWDGFVANADATITLAPPADLPLPVTATLRGRQ